MTKFLAAFFVFLLGVTSAGRAQVHPGEPPIHAGPTSSQVFRSIITDPSGTGSLLFGTAPSITSPTIAGTGTFPDGTTWSSAGISNALTTITAPLTNGIDSGNLILNDANGIFGGGYDLFFKALTATHGVATFTGSASASTTLVVTGISGTLAVGDGIEGTGVTYGAVKIASQLSGPVGGNGTYTTNIATSASGTITARRSTGNGYKAAVVNGGFCDNTASAAKGDVDVLAYNVDGSGNITATHGVSLTNCQQMFGPLASNDLDLGAPTNLWKTVYSNSANVAGGVVVLDGANGVGTTNKVWAFETTAVPVGGAVATGIFLSSALNGSGHPTGFYFGSGAASVDAAQGSYYMRTDGFPAFNTTGTTGWDEFVGRTSTQTLTNKTISGASNTLSAIALSSLSAQSANTLVGNATAGSASPTALAAPSCSTASSALTWTTSTGLGCNTSINAATLGGATFAAPGAIGGTTPAAGAFTTLSASGSAGLSVTKTVRNSAGTGTCDLTFTSGLLTASTC